MDRRQQLQRWIETRLNASPLELEVGDVAADNREIRFLPGRLLQEDW